MDRRVFLFSALALLLAILGYITASDITTGVGNGTNFTLNITGNPPINDSVTLIAGSNITLTQSGHNITINLTESDRSKVNKSGDTMTGKLLIDSSNILPGTDLNYSFETRYNGTTRTFLYAKYGIQEWQINGGSSEKGYISYTTPGASPPYTSVQGLGINLYEPGRVNANLTRIVAYNEGLIINVYNETIMKATIFFNRTSGDFTISSLSGSGNANVCVDANGKLYRAQTCL